MSVGNQVHARRSIVATLHPAYFAMVMATGIVSIAAHLQQLPAVAVTLFWLNNLFYLVLAFLLAARAVFHTRLLLADLGHHGRAVGLHLGETLKAGATQAQLLAECVQFGKAVGTPAERAT